MSRGHPFIRLCILGLTLTLAGCAGQPRDFKSPVQPAAVWSQTGEQTLPEKWWLSFQDPSLNQLIDIGLAGNFSFRTVWDRLTAARAIARREGADLWPDVQLGAGARRTRQDIDSRTDYETNYNLGLTVSYELDLWGRVRSVRDAAALDALAASEDVFAAAITLTAGLAIRWYQYAEARQRIWVLTEQTRTNELVLDIIQVQFRAGQAQAQDWLRQKNLVEANRGDLYLAQQQAQVFCYQIASLLGRRPDAPLPVDDAKLIQLPGLPDIGLPSQVLQRRPDVRNAYRDVQAADRRVASAVADQYPRVSLTASGVTSGRSSDLFNNWAATLAGNLVQPLFDGGQRDAEVDRTRAVTSEAINFYAQTVLDAFEEVETAMERERRQTQYLKSLTRQLKTAQQVIERVRDSYLNGQTEYINVLDALTSQQSLELQKLTAQRELIGFRIDLCRAIAGGWVMTDPEQATFVPVARSEHVPAFEPTLVSEPINP